MNPPATTHTRETPAVRQDMNPGVRFSHTTSVCFVPGLWDMTNEQKTAMWYTERDNAKIQMNTLKTVKRMRRGSLDEDKYCSRGLEHLGSTALLEEKRRAKESVCLAVLAEQRRQRATGNRDPGRMGQIASAHTAKSRDTALQLAAADALAAEKIPDTSPGKKKEDECVSILESALELTCASASQQSSEDETKHFSINKDALRGIESAANADQPMNEANENTAPRGNILTRVADQLTRSLSAETKQADSSVETITLRSLLERRGT